MQHIDHLSHASVMLRATWLEGIAQLLSLTEVKSHLFDLYFIGLTIKLMKDGGKPKYPEKILVTSFRICHLLQPEDSSSKRDSNPHSSIGGRLGKQTC